MNVRFLKRFQPSDGPEAKGQVPPVPTNDDMPLTETGKGEAGRPNPRRIIMMLVGAVAVIFIGYKVVDWFIAGRFEVSTNNAYIRADIATIAPKVQGYVTKVHVLDNQQVKAGDLLVTLESADYAAQLAEAEAALSQAEAGAVQARARVASAAAALDTAQSEIAAQRDRMAEASAEAEAAAADAALTASDYQRYEELAARGHYSKAALEAVASKDKATQADLQQSRAAITTRRSELSVAQAAYHRAQEELSAAKAAVTGADASVEAARARVEAARLNATRTEMRAPIDGVVANRAVTEGQLMSPGQQAMSIVPVQSSYIVANFKETQVEKMRAGQPVHVRVDAYPGLKVEGRLASIAPATGSQFSLIPQDTATGNFTKIVQRVPVRIDLSDDARATGLMRPGLSVEVTVLTRTDG